jgi:ankyrin repeat protein
MMEYDCKDMVAYLLGNGLSATLRTNRGVTPLMYGAGFSSIGVLQRLLEHMGGQGLDAVDEVRSTALHWAAFSNGSENVRALLVAGADPTIVDAWGRTPRAVAEGGLHEHPEGLSVFNVSTLLSVSPWYLRCAQ